MDSSSEMPTEEEMEVAGILENLAQLFMAEEESGLLPLSVHWGKKRMRSAGNQPSHPVVPHPPPNSATRSPTSPLRFYPSGGAKNAEGHKEWVKAMKQQYRTIAMLWAHKVNLERMELRVVESRPQSSNLQPPAVAPNQRWRAFMIGMRRPAVPDLNSVAEEQVVGQQQQETRAAMAAQARKRRIELQREKNLSASVMYKIPRLR